jgi:hypothetical protein
MIRTLALATSTLALALTGCARPHAVASASARPGLGTSWGEARESAVRSVPFEREDPARPDAVVLLQYDDRAGVLAAERGFAEGPGDAGDEVLRVRLLDAQGTPLRQFRRGGGHRYVEGRDGERYTIEIENRNDTRIEAVATVDGLDVMDGEPGSFDKRGYLVGPWATLRIEGFRRSLSEVAAFRFGSVAESYAARKGDDTNVGVIGVACFAERGSGRRARTEEAQRRRRADAFPDGFAQPPPRGW